GTACEEDMGAIRRPDRTATNSARRQPRFHTARQISYPQVGEANLGISAHKRDARPIRRERKPCHLPGRAHSVERSPCPVKPSQLAAPDRPARPVDQNTVLASPTIPPR